MNIAAIDIGTNSIHMVIAHVEGPRIFEIIDREKEMVFLGKKSLLKGRLTEDAIDRGLSALVAFKQIADSHHVDQIIATATSAVRESSNGEEFIRSVKEKTGIEIQLLSGKEEARMITLAVRDVIDLKDRKALIVDIGGGSMELIVADANNIFFAESIKSGVIRLTERFVTSDPPNSKELKRFQKWLNGKIEPLSKRIQNLAPDLAVGTSGTILAFGEMAAQARKNSKAEKPVLKITELETINEKLQKMTVEERLKFPGMDRNRAEQSIAGGLLIETVMEKCRINQLVLCDRALREGLLADYLIRTNPSPSARNIQARELRGKSVLALLDRWKIDRSHAEHTAKLSLQVFDALSDIHEYGPDERQLLEYATLLHDIGRVISYPRHHRHGWYIVKNSNLIGFQPEEIDILAASVAYHRGKKPRKRDGYMTSLGRKQRKLVKFLTAILRVADGLDRQHNQLISKIKAQQEQRNHLVFTLYAQEPALIPLRAAVERSALLQKLLKVKHIEFRSETSVAESAARVSAG
jgi:exopolyphosphatase/guanosine-5'-triphosphate,3'-diphosphate pyrophosphatase